jgi:hypothetical protein
MAEDKLKVTKLDGKASAIIRIEKAFISVNLKTSL